MVSKGSAKIIRMSLSRDRRPEPALGRVFQAFLAAGWFLRCFLGGKKRQRTAGEDRGFTTFCGQKVHKPPQGNPAVSCRPKSGKDQQSKTVFSTFNIKYFVYESFGNRFRRPACRRNCSTLRRALAPDLAAIPRTCVPEDAASLRSPRSPTPGPFSLTYARPAK